MEIVISHWTILHADLDVPVRIETETEANALAALIPGALAVPVAGNVSFTTVSD